MAITEAPLLMKKNPGLQGYAGVYIERPDRSGYSLTPNEVSEQLNVLARKLSELNGGDPFTLRILLEQRLMNKEALFLL